MPTLEARFSLLLATLVLLLLIGPPLAEDGWAGFALSTMFSSVLVAGALVVGERGRVWIASVVLVGVALVAEVLLHATGLAFWIVTARISSALFLAFATVMIGVRILQTDEVTADTILGGCCIYLLLGVLFTAVHTLVEYFAPGSYLVAGRLLPETAAGGGLGRFPELIYFSIVTLTTLGYGDVTPARPLAQSLSALESAAGQLFLAILIARLVGLHLHGPRGRGRA